MPIWLQILLIFLGGLLLCIVLDMVRIIFCGCVVRDNIVFKNKYQRKIYQLKEKLRKYEERINNRIDYFNYKNIYCENIKILHEKRLDNTILMTSKDFMKISKKKGNK